MIPHVKMSRSISGILNQMIILLHNRLLSYKLVMQTVFLTEIN